MNAKNSAAQAEDAENPNADVNLEAILDVSVTLSMEVGRTRIPIRNLLQLNQGSVVELDRAAGEPIRDGLEHRLHLTRQTRQDEDVLDHEAGCAS